MPPCVQSAMQYKREIFLDDKHAMPVAKRAETRNDGKRDVGNSER